MTWVPPEWFSRLPQELQDLAHSLVEQHQNEYAFPVETALKVLPTLRDMGVSVLGGDFYARDEAGKLVPTYQNWDINDSGLSHDELIAKSCEMAIAEVSKPSRRDRYVVIVCK